jgi:uncharacterized protein YbaR (Trm112 family)
VKLAAGLLDILACPQCHAPLRAEEAADELACTDPGCRRVYPVREDIPVLLVDEARIAPASGDSA